MDSTPDSRQVVSNVEEGELSLEVIEANEKTQVVGLVTLKFVKPFVMALSPGDRLALMEMFCDHCGELPIKCKCGG